MAQNKIDKVYTAAELKEIDDALIVLERYYAGFTVLTTLQKQRMVKLPDGGGEFVENMDTLSKQYADLMPGKYDSVLLDRDNTFSDQNAPILIRAETLVERITSAQMLVDSDRFATALYIRRTLKENGKEDGLDKGLDEGIKRFLSRSGDDAIPATPATTPVAAPGK